ncbi:MAG TPA: ABC transporter permease [Terracidiphilus sp.]|jgi:predicted permease|nr:ABC transporter permease [Terracidiphilus sp.]
MDWIPQIFRRGKFYEDLSEEIRLHIEERTEQLMCDGMSREEAERTARMAFGNRTSLEERSREVWQWPTLESILSDVRFAMRQLRKSPGFTVAAVLTLALAIGANAVVFAVLNGVILRPLNVPHADSLYGLEHSDDHMGQESYPNYLDLRDRSRGFESLVAWNISQVGIDTGGDPSRAWVTAASGNYFDALGIQPFIGRTFHPGDERGLNSAPYIVLGYAYWHSHFRDDRSVLGRVIQINKHPFTVIGVAPPGFRGTLLFFNPDFYVPIVNQPQVNSEFDLNTRGLNWIFETMGHLKPGVTPGQATADLNSIASYLGKTYPVDDGGMQFILARPSLYGDFMGKPMLGFLTALMTLSGLILLAACSNLGSLFAARAADRSRELALRLALGSSRNRILRQLLTEATLISLAGGAVGLLGGVAILRRLSVWQPFPQFPVQIPVDPDAKVYVVALALALISGLLFGIVPVRQVLKTNPYEIVKVGSAGVGGRRVTLRDVLLVLQIAICAVLITSSMVAVRGLARSMHSNFGFEPQDVMIADTGLGMAGYSGDRELAMQRRMIDAMKTIPGVQSAASINWAPLSGGANSWNAFTDEAKNLKPSSAAAGPYWYNISPDYFQAADTTLLAGRTFTWQDDKNAPLVAVVNREFARKLFGSDKDAVGKHFQVALGGDIKRIEVVGLVVDGKYQNLTEDQAPAVFVPLLQEPMSQTYLVVRSNGDPQQLAAAIRGRLHDLDEGLPVNIQTWTQLMTAILFPARMSTVALGILGMMGAMLSITGIFGMAAYSVSKRLKELGIRMALGAQRKEVLQAALGRAFKLLAIGSAAGMVLGILAGRVLASIVYQATPRDPVVLVGVVLAMAALGLLATWIPAQRALSVSPLILLRED